jgi:hypothetical protein
MQSVMKGGEAFKKGTQREEHTEMDREGFWDGTGVGRGKRKRKTKRLLSSGCLLAASTSITHHYHHLTLVLFLGKK